MSHDDTLRYMKAADMFVLNTSYEGFSHVILEALAVEVPIITTPMGGNIEIIKNDVNGRFFSYNDKDALKMSILEFLNNPEKSRELSKIGKNDLSKFSEDNMLTQLSKVLNI